MSGWEWRGVASGGDSGGGESRPATATDVPAHNLSEKMTPAAVRQSAASWSLAGDRQLLHLLESIQQSVMERCSRVTARLDEMTSALDSASVALQNVNNRFSALGNTQFMECRVYDDEVTDDATQRSAQQSNQKGDGGVESAATNEPPGVAEVLGRYYDEVHIAPDSDSESDSGREDSVVLRPRDMYAERPLPHVIGTPAWHNKWHVGLIEEDSDTDSSLCKREREEDQYSSCDSYEPSHPTFDSRIDKYAYSGETAMSEDSESRVTDAPPPATTPPPKPSPSDFAAELARRLGGGAVAPVAAEHARADRAESRPRAARAAKTFLNEIPQSRVTGNIFSDEPPPIDEAIESEPDDRSYDDDIFADLRNTNIFNRNSNVTNRNAKTSQYGGLFDDLMPEDNERDEKDIFDDFADDNRNVLKRSERNDNKLFDDELFADAGTSNVKTAKSVIPASVAKTGGLFDDEEEEDLFADHVKPKPDNGGVIGSREAKTSATTRPVIPENTVSNTKKPVGGISLFGTNQGAENIGAAILKHHQRKASVSSDDNDESFDDSSKVETRSSRTEDRSNMDSTDDDFDDLFAVKTKKPVNANAKFDDLFAKSIERNRSMEKENSVEESNSTAEQKNIEVNTNVREKSDKLFDIKSQQQTKVLPKADRKGDSTKSVFADDLFDSAKSLEKETVEKKTSIKEKSIFSDDLFDDTTAEQKNIKVNTNVIEKSSTDKLFDIKSQKQTKVLPKTKGDAKSVFADDLFDSAKSLEKETVKKTSVKEKSIFSDDLFDDSNIFTSTMISKSDKPVKTEAIKDLFGDDSDIFADVITEQKPKIKQTKTKSLFDDDSDDDIFANLVKPETQKKPVDPIIDLSKNVDRESANNSETIDTIDTKENVIVSNITKTLEKKTVIQELPPKPPMSNKPEIVVKPNLIEKPTITMENRKKFPDTSESTSNHSIEKIEPKILEKPELKDKHISTSSKENPNMAKSDVFKESPANLAVEKDAGKSIQKDEINVEPPDLIAENPISEIKPSSANKNTDGEETDESISKPIEKTSIIIEKPVVKEKPVIEKICDVHIVKDHSVDTNFTTATVKPESEISNKPPELPNLVTEIQVMSRSTDKYESMSQSENPGDDFFNTIFDDQPPVFQRSTESKKSKNINALFDDDSDDEGLFLKKHDTISITNSDDSKSVDEFLPPSEDRLFGIFHTDPPDLDVNFAVKREDSDDFDRNDQLDSNFEEEDSVTAVKEVINVEKEELGKGDTAKNVPTKENTPDNFFEDLEYVKIIRNEDGQKRREILSPNKAITKPTEINNLDLKIGTESLTHTSDVIQKQKGTIPKQIDENLQNERMKTVGKLKLPNLNINVQGLLPGAIPKKPTKTDNTKEEFYKPEVIRDGSNVNKIDKTEEMHASNEATSSKHDSLDGSVIGIAKSVSFDKGPDSPTLVNAYSKERAKIQVKRRPSTRKARKDAIRKSAHNLDFESDTGIVDITDSFTVSLPTSPRDVTRSLESNLIDNAKEDIDKAKTTSQHVNVDKINTSIVVNKNQEEAVKINTNITNIHKLLTESDNSYRNLFEDNEKIFKKEKLSETYSDGSSSEGTGVNTLGKTYSERTTKVFDEDDAKLFTFDASESKKEPLKSFQDRTDDLFASTAVKRVDNLEKPNFERSQASALFDPDDSEIDELFKPNVIGTKTGAIKTKKDIENNKVTAKSNEEVPEASAKTVVKKTSLFEDDIDDDVLFGAKTINTLRETKISNVHEKLTAPEDLFPKRQSEMKQSKEKASLFGDDSDDDIFGTKKNVKAPATMKPSQSKENAAATSAEEVFEDPLSLFD